MESWILKTTKRHFDLFVKECKKWIKIFGLFGWEFSYSHNDYPNLNVAAYCIWPDEPAETNFTLGLCVTNDDVITDAYIRKCAFHEVMEAFLYKMIYLARARYVHPEEIAEERHHIIRTLERVVFENKR